MVIPHSDHFGGVEQLLVVSVIEGVVEYLSDPGLILVGFEEVGGREELDVHVGSISHPEEHVCLLTHHRGEHGVVQLLEAFVAGAEEHPSQIGA